MCDAGRVIEMASYALIALVGARLIWVKGKGFLREARSLSRPLHAVGAAVTPPHDHKHHDHEHHDHDHRSCHDHASSRSCITITATIIHDHHDHDHDHGSAWGHAHGPEPEELAGPGGWQRGLSAIVAVGLRPCSGAIIVLVFALAQGLFWAGVAATFVMGLGTAITVAAIATLAVGFRSAAKQIAGSRSGYGMLAHARHRGRRRRRRAGLRRAAARRLSWWPSAAPASDRHARWPRPSPRAAASPAAGRPA